MDFDLSRRTGEEGEHLHDTLTKQSEFVLERRNTVMFEENVDKQLE